MDYPKIDFTKMSCPPGLEFNKPYTMEEIKQAMRRVLIDNSYVGEWMFDTDQKIDQYAAYAKCDINKGDIIMECLIPFQWLSGRTQQMKDYRITVDYGEKDGVRNIMPLGNVLVMNYGRDTTDANCTVLMPQEVSDRIITVIASQDIKKDDELRWLYIGEGKEI